MDKAATLYKAALAADAAYTKAIAFVTGGRRDRWTLTAEDEQASAIQVALAKKIAADAAWSEAQRRGWEQTAR